MIVATSGNNDEGEEHKRDPDWKDLIVCDRLSDALINNGLNYDSLKLLTNKNDIELLLQELSINLKITEKIQFISSLLKSINKDNNDNQNEQKIQHVIITKEEEDAQQQLVLKDRMISKSIKRLNTNLKGIENAYTRCETNINDVFNDFIQIIESRKYQLLNGLKQISNAKTKYIDKQLKQFNNYQQQIHSVHREFQQNLMSCSVINDHHKRKLVNINLVNNALSNMNEIGIDNANSNNSTDIQLDFNDVLRMKSMIQHFGQIYDNDTSIHLKPPMVYIKSVGSNFVEFVIIDTNEYDDKMKISDNSLYYEINYCFDQKNISDHVEHKAEEENKWKTKQIRKILPMQPFKFYLRMQPFNMKFDAMSDKILARFRICNNTKCSVYSIILSVHLFDLHYIIQQYHDDMLCVYTKFIAVQTFMDNVETIDSMMMFCDAIRQITKYTKYNDDNNYNLDNMRKDDIEFLEKLRTTLELRNESKMLAADLEKEYKDVDDDENTQMSEEEAMFSDFMSGLMNDLKRKNEELVDVHNRTINTVMNTANIKRFRYFCLTNPKFMNSVKQSYHNLEEIIESIEETVTVITMKMDQTDCNYWNQVISIKNMIKEANDIFSNIGMDDEFVNLQFEVAKVLFEPVCDIDDELEDLMEDLEEEEEDELKIEAIDTSLMENNDEIIFEGCLQKQSLHLKKFRNRFIVLKNKYLYCYKVGANNKLTEQIDLKMFHGAKLSDDFLGKQFELIPKNLGDKNAKKRVFMSSSVNEVVNWIAQINAVMNWRND